MRDGPAPTRVAPEVLAAFLAELRASGAVTAAEARVATLEESVAARVDVAPGALFDLASLTKPFVATLALALHEEGSLPLDLPLGRLWPTAAAGLRRKTLGSLLRHRSGLVPWAPLYALCRTAEEAAERIVAGEWWGAAPDTYSDLGFLLWGSSAARALGLPVSELLEQRVLAPLGLRSIAAAPPAERAVPCRIDTGREVELARRMGRRIGVLAPPAPGQPQDGNTRFLGGLPGHAGLFGDAGDLVTFAREWLGAGGRVVGGTTVRRALAGSGRHALGWMRRRLAGSAGPALGPGSFGHTGFTGGSLWIDPRGGRIWVLLAHRSSSQVDLDPWRRRFHALACGAVSRAHP